MPYLLLIFFPLAIAASCFVVRKHSRLAITVALAAVLTLTALVAQIPLDAPARMLGVTLILGSLGRLFMLAFLGVAAVTLALNSTVCVWFGVL